MTWQTFPSNYPLRGAISSTSTFPCLAANLCLNSLVRSLTHSWTTCNVGKRKILRGIEKVRWLTHRLKGFLDPFQPYLQRFSIWLFNTWWNGHEEQIARLRSTTITDIAMSCKGAGPWYDIGCSGRPTWLECQETAKKTRYKRMG